MMDRDSSLMVTLGLKSELTMVLWLDHLTNQPTQTMIHKVRRAHTRVRKDGDDIILEYMVVMQ
jgi:hypothetical protein